MVIVSTNVWPAMPMALWVVFSHISPYQSCAWWVLPQSGGLGTTVANLPVLPVPLCRLYKAQVPAVVGRMIVERKYILERRGRRG